MKKVIGIVLGGGRGTRLFPLTHVRSKPAVPLGGKYRLVDIPLSNCINSDINKIYVVTQYNSESLNRHIVQTYRFGPFSQGFVDILAAEQTPDSATWFQGTADAVRRCLRHLLSYDAEHYLILSGDQLYRMDFQDLMRSHRERKADLSVCVIGVEREKSSSFGILKMSSDGRLEEFHEKPDQPELVDRLQLDAEGCSRAGISVERPLMASMGIYLFNRETLIDSLVSESLMDFGKDVIPAALKKYAVFGYLFKGYWEDIGTIDAFYRANLGLTTRRPDFTFFHDGFPIYTHQRFLPPNRLRNCRFTESVIAEGCSIWDSEVNNSVIGIRSVIRDSEVEGTLLMGADYYDPFPKKGPPLGISSGSVVRKAIVDKNARIGRGVRITNEEGHVDSDGPNYYIRDGIVIIPKNTTIEDGTVI